MHRKHRMREGQASWQGLFDGSRGAADRPGEAPCASVSERDLLQLEAWENEGGKARMRCAPLLILIVDNDRTSAATLELMLHAAGYRETRVAYTGDDALAIAREFQPSVVFLELNLLGANGYALAQTLREHAQTQSLRLIALTTSREHRGREQARVAGFERYLLKPVAASALLDLLRMPAEV